MALDYLRRHFRLSRAEMDPSQTSGALSHIGILQADLGLYATARRSHRKAIRIARRYSLSTRSGEILNNLGGTHRAQGNWALVIRRSRSAALVLRVAGSNPDVVIAEVNIGLALARAGYHEDAAGQLRHRMNTNRGQEPVQSTSYVLSSWAVLLFEVGLYSSCLRVAGFASTFCLRRQLWASL